MPVISLGLIYSAAFARLTRGGMLDVIRQDYIRTARAKGLDNETVVMRHGMRNALIPILTIAGLQFGYLLGGAVLTETVFSWPGMGTYIIQSIENRDLLAVQGAVFVLAAMFVLVNLAVDILYSFVDPRIRYGSS